MFDRAWLMVLSIVLAPVIPVLALLFCPGLTGVSAVVAVFLLAATSVLAMAS